MIVFLLLVIIAILLFGASAVLGVARTVAIAVLCLIGLLFLIGIGWTGVLWIAGAVAAFFAFAFLKDAMDQRNRNHLQHRLDARYVEIMHEENSRQQERADRARVQAAIERDRKLAAEYREKIRQRSEGKAP